MLLKEFRDKFLLTNNPGRRFVSAYYRYSPPVADFISRHQTLKLVVRMLLYPLLGFSYILMRLSLSMQLTLSAMVVAGMTVATVIIRRRRKA
ncbi:MAG: hypothetical protein ACD_75C01639G0001 [uncultured bacterium]|nr:MAG: hypothetical protein ACD_75C01639G0001 [uncultured bacterium]